IALVELGGESLDVAGQLERLDEWEVPPELHPLAEHHADAPGELGPLPGRDQARDRDPAPRRHEDAGQHLHRRGLARAVRADVADEASWLDREGQVRDRVDDVGPAAEATGGPPHHEVLSDMLELDRRPVYPPAL